MTRGQVTRDDLHAAADGRLQPPRREALERHLAADQTASEQVAFYRRLNEGLHRLYDPLLAEPLPSELAEALGRGRGRRRLVAGFARAAAVAALLTFGAAAGWLARGYFPVADVTMARSDLPRLAADAHLVYAAEVRHPVEVGADQEAHLVAWLSKRLGAEVRAPSLAGLGYRLIGGRLLPADGGVAGQFMYENDAGTRLTLFLANGRNGDTAFRFVEEDGVSVFYWRDEGLGYALSAELPREKLLVACNEIYAQLYPDAGPARW